MLIKISSEKYIDEIQKQGKFYCNSLKYFRELENDGYIADQNEGKQYIKQVGKIELLIDGNVIAYANSGQFFPDGFDKGNIFCFYGFQTSKLDLTTKNLQKVNFEIEADRIGEHVLLILDIPEFSRRLQIALEEQQILYQFGPVKYLDFQTYEGELSPYTKSNKFESQCEIRLWIPRDEENEFIFYIGDISDISYKCKIDDLNKIEVEVLK